MGLTLNIKGVEVKIRAPNNPGQSGFDDFIQKTKPESSWMVKVAIAIPFIGGCVYDLRARCSSEEETKNRESGIILIKLVGGSPSGERLSYLDTKEKRQFAIDYTKDRCFTSVIHIARSVVQMALIIFGFATGILLIHPALIVVASGLLLSSVYTVLTQYCMIKRLNEHLDTLYRL